MKEGLALAHNLFLGNSKDSYFGFACFTLFSVLLLFDVSITFIFYCLCTIFNAGLSTIGKVLSVNLPEKVFVFRDFSIHDKYW